MYQGQAVNEKPAPRIIPTSKAVIVSPHPAFESYLRLRYILPIPVRPEHVKSPTSGDLKDVNIYTTEDLPLHLLVHAKSITVVKLAIPLSEGLWKYAGSSPSSVVFLREITIDEFRQYACAARTYVVKGLEEQSVNERQ